MERRSLKKAGIKIMTNSSVERINYYGAGVKAFVKSKRRRSLEEILLFGFGIKTNIENIGLEVGIATDKDKYSKRLQ
jgi:dihydrolipoamide dehydrogenase